MEKITGKNNEIIKGVKKLFTSSKERKAQGLFVLEGARLVFDALNSSYEVETSIAGWLNRLSFATPSRYPFPVVCVIISY